MTDAPTPESPSIWDDFIDIWTSPTALFARRADGKWGHAMIFFVVLGAILFFGTRGATAPIFEAEMARGMAASSQQLTPEQLEAGRSVARVMTPIMVVIGGPILLLLLALGVWLATKLMGGAISFAQGLTIACFAEFPRLVEAVSTAVQAMLMEESALTGRYSVSLGVGRFFDPDTAHAALLALVGRIDIFTLWITVLVTIGIKVVGKRSTDQAVMAGAIVWLLGALPTVVPALFQG